MDAGTLCSPQGNKVQFDSKLIKQVCDTKDGPSWVCDPLHAGNNCKSRNMKVVNPSSCLLIILRT